MPKKKLYRTDLYPYHIVSRANNKEFFPLPIEELWKEFNLYLTMVHIMYRVRIHAHVLMGNHYHLILTTPQQNLDLVMKYFNRSLALTINQKTGRINRVFGARYKWTVIRDVKYLERVFRYLYQNPVKAKLSKNVESYPYSSIRQIVGLSSFECPLYPIQFASNKLDISPYEFLELMNQRMSSDDNEVIQKALYHSVFKVNSRRSKRA